MRYIVLYWVGLVSDEVWSAGFDERQEMVDFAEKMKGGGFSVLVADMESVTTDGQKKFSISRYGYSLTIRLLLVLCWVFFLSTIISLILILR